MTTTTAVQLDIAPLSGTIGAEIRAVDLHHALDPETLAAVRQALLDYKVIFFPGQHLSPQEHKDFAASFGEITVAHPVIPGLDDHREVFEIDYTKARALVGGTGSDYDDRENWHTDVTFVETPPLGSILNAIVIPKAGGDTLWADTQAAYEGLSEPIRRFVDGLTAVHDGSRSFGKVLEAVGNGEWDGETFTELVQVEHPVVRTHPETGRRNLFVNPGFTKRIKGLTARESDAILQFLYRHMTTPEYVVRYRWEEGDLGFWDNRTTMHYAIHDYGSAHRVIQRVTTAAATGPSETSRPPHPPIRPLGPVAAPSAASKSAPTKGYPTTMLPTRPRATTRRRHVAPRLAATTMVAGLALLGTASGASAAGSRAERTTSLAGVTITFGDQLKEFQTIFAATDALKGAPYTVNFANFVGGPPVIAAETGGSVDIGDMAETPTIFAQAAGDPVKVVAATVGVNPKKSPYDIVVPTSSPIKTLAQLKGHTVAVQEGTVEQYFLVQALAKAKLPYSAVTIDNLAVTTASTAVTNGQVDAAVISQPLTALDLATGKVRVLATGAGLLQTIGYLTATNSALANPQKAAALTDFIGRFYKASAILAKEPQLAAETYAKTYGVSVAVAEQAVASVQEVGTSITPAIISYQQTEANTFQKLGLISSRLNVKGIFDLPFNRAVSHAAGLVS